MKTIIATIALSFAFSAHAGTIGSGPHGGMSERIPPHAVTSR